MKYKIKQSSNDVIDSIYLNRDIDENKIESWLNANEDAWEDPSSYPFIHEAYECLMKHIRNNDDIFVLSDSDTDGLFSSGILMNFVLKYLKYENIYYILHKRKAHGLTHEVMDKCLKNDVKLVICPDAASNDIKQMEELMKNGIDFIALDHHEYSPDDVPEGTIVVNNQHPKVKNKYGSGTLTTYKFIFYVAEQEGIDLGYDYLDCCNVANISDMMDMNTDNLENRYIWRLGSDVRNINNKLIKTFVKDLKRKNKLTIEDVSYNIAPKINSIVRLGSMEEKELLMESAIGLSCEEVEYKYRGQIKTQSIYDSIIRISNKCKSSQKRKIEKYVQNGLELLTSDDDRLIIVKGDEIENSLRGLLANKLAGEYQKPVFILSGNDELRGSARTVGDIDLMGISEASKLTMFTAGHLGAFGTGLLRGNIDKFIKYMNKALMGLELGSVNEVDYVYEDGMIPLDDVIDIGSLNDVWCSSMKRPKLLVKNISINSKNISKKGIDMSFKVGDVSFRRDFCSRAFYEDLICYEDNPDIDKDLDINLICEVKTWENGRSYVNICDFESRVIK